MINNGIPPPQNLDFEESVLSAALLFDESRYYFLGKLRPKHFYATKHQIIFNAITALTVRSDPIDVNTLREALVRTKRLDAAGGVTMLAKLLGDVPLPSDDEHYANVLLQKAAMRQLITAAYEISSLAFNANGNAEQVLAESYAKILQVDIGQQSRELVSVDTVLDETIEHIEAVAKRGGTGGIATGFADLDQLTGGVHAGEVTILAGRPSMGKTALALNIARNLGENQVKTAIFSLEMARIQMVTRLLGLQSKVSSQRFRSGCLSPQDWQDISNAANELHTFPILLDDTPRMHYGELIRKMHRAVMKEGVKFVIIDYMGFLSGDDQRSRVTEIGQISRAIKAAAKELKVPIMVLNQLNRKCEERPDKRPRLSDLRDSGDLEQDADNVLLLFRSAAYNRDPNDPHRHTAEIILAKQRNGPVGTVRLLFIENQMEFASLAKHQQCDY